MQNIKNRERGLILIVSLWILAIISLLSVSLAHRVIVNLKLVKFQREKMRCLYIAKAAVQKSINVIENDETFEVDFLAEPWSRGYNEQARADPYIFKEVKLGKGKFSVSYVYDAPEDEEPLVIYGLSDEERKINLNFASRELLISLLEVIATDDPDALAENIIYWRGDAPDHYEDSYYRSSEVPYAARKGHFKTVEELSLVKGFREDPQLLQECERIFTVYTADNSININTASHQVLKAVFMSLGAEEASFGLSEKLADNVIDFRDGYDNQPASDDDTAIDSESIKAAMVFGLGIGEVGWVNNQVFPFTVKSNLFRINVAARMNAGRAVKNITAIIDRSREPLKIRYWHET